MQIDPQLSEFSDLAFRSAESLYLLALAISLVFYGMVRVGADRRRQRAEELEKLQAGHSARAASTTKVTVGAGAAGNAADSDVADAGEITGDDIEPDFASFEAQLPERLRSESISKTLDRSNKLGGITQSLVWLAIAIHAVFVILRGLAANRFPWGNLFEYVGVVTLFAMVVAALMIRRKAMRVMWPWILTPVAGLLFYAGTKLYAETAPVVPALQSYWFVIHVSVVSIGAGIGLISGVASLMYLLRYANPKGEEKGWLGTVAAPLPDVTKLDALAYRTAVWALPIFGLGIIFGAIWADAAWGRFWGWDPKETVSFITWILYAAYLHARATPGWRGPKSAWINVFAFATMVFNLFFINMVVSGLHSYAGLN